MINLRVISCLFVLFFLAEAADSTITVSDRGGEDFITIQSAIDAASPGDTVEVLAGTYRENVVVNRTLTLRGLDLPVVDALGSGSAITIKADGVVLEGLVATNSSGYIFRGMPDRFGGAGIMVFSENNTIQDNVASSNSGCGIIIQWASSNDTIIGNNISDNLERGIFLGGSFNNLISNIVCNNSEEGIYFDGAQNNVLVGNTVCNNSGGIILALSDNNTLRRNLIFGNKENLADFSRNNTIDASNLIEGVIADNVDRLIQKLKDNDLSVRAAAAEVLGGIRDARVVGPLIQSLRDNDSWVRSNAVNALTEIRDPRAVEPLIQTLENDNDSSVRAAAAEALGKMNDTMAVEPLIRSLENDSDMLVRDNAAEALGNIGDKKAVDPLIKELNDTDIDHGVIVESLGKINDTMAVEPLIRALNDNDDYVRAAAAEALGTIRDARAVVPLILALKNNNSLVRGYAAGALALINDSRAIGPLTQALKDDDAYVRRTARMALEKLGIYRAATAAVITVGQNGSYNYTSIQAAIDNSSEGDIIEVRRGAYLENVLVNKRLTLRGIEGPIVNAGKGEWPEYDAAFTLVADEIVLEGFTVQGSHSAPLNPTTGSGIEVNSNNNIIRDNIARDNYNSGISIWGGMNNTIIANNITGNGDGIFLNDASNNTIVDNNISYSWDKGVFAFENARNNIIIANSISHNSQGTYSEGEGILLDRRANNNIIIANDISYNSEGLHINIDSNYNMIYLNNFIGNTKSNVYDNGIINLWDNGTIGNYYSDLSCGNGVIAGNATYTIQGNGSSVDRFPLTNPSICLVENKTSTQISCLGVRR